MASDLSKVIASCFRYYYGINIFFNNIYSVGEPVEYDLQDSGDSGRSAAAINVTGPNGADVEGASKEDGRQDENRRFGGGGGRRSSF